MRRRLALIACLAITASLTDAAKADPIMGTVTLTLAQAYDPYDSAISQGPVVFSSGSTDLSQLFLGQILPGPGGGETWGGLNLTGPLLLKWSGLGSENIKTTFDLKITFDGAAGSHPTIDATGPISVNATSTPDGSNSYVGIYAYGAPTSATVQGWTPESGVPLSLINNYLNTSNYYLVDYGPGYEVGYENAYPTTSAISLESVQSAVTFVPEPATVLIYLAAIAGLGVRRGTRLWRSDSAH